MTVPNGKAGRTGSTSRPTRRTAKAGRPGRDAEIASTAGVTVELSEEQLVAEIATHVSGSVRLTRQIVTEKVTIEVDVQREELLIEDLEPRGQRVMGKRARKARLREPTVIVLHEQFPEVYLSTRPYERVTARVEQVHETAEFEAEISHEELDLMPPEA